MLWRNKDVRCCLCYHITNSYWIMTESCTYRINKYNFSEIFKQEQRMDGNGCKYLSKSFVCSRLMHSVLCKYILLLHARLH